MGKNGYLALDMVSVSPSEWLFHCCWRSQASQVKLCFKYSFQIMFVSSLTFWYLLLKILCGKWNFCFSFSFPVVISQADLLLDIQIVVRWKISDSTCSAVLFFCTPFTCINAHKSEIWNHIFEHKVGTGMLCFLI